MTTEKHDPWALLAEIHELQPWLSQDADLAARVDAALAEHADSATPVVESDESNAVWRAYANRELSEDEAKAKLAALEAKSAALAEHEAEQQVTWSPNGKGLDATVSGYLVEVQPTHDGWWGWRAEQFPVHRDRQHGHKRTKELAQDAAIAAAKEKK